MARASTDIRPSMIGADGPVAPRPSTGPACPSTTEWTARGASAVVGRLRSARWCGSPPGGARTRSGFDDETLGSRDRSAGGCATAGGRVSRNSTGPQKWHSAVHSGAPAFSVAAVMRSAGISALAGQIQRDVLGRVQTGHRGAVGGHGEVIVAAAPSARAPSSGDRRRRSPRASHSE